MKDRKGYRIYRENNGFTVYADNEGISYPPDVWVAENVEKLQVLMGELFTEGKDCKECGRTVEC